MLDFQQQLGSAVSSGESVSEEEEGYLPLTVYLAILIWVNDLDDSSISILFLLFQSSGLDSWQ